MWNVFFLFGVLCWPGLVAADMVDAMAAHSKGDYKTEIEEYRKMAAQGSTYGQTMLAGMYRDGKGVPQDYAEAMKWLQRAAESEERESQFNLGLEYERGEIVPKNYREAVEWYRKSADQGLPDAQIELGYLYEKGIGVPRDILMAHMFYNLAASSDNLNAGGLEYLPLLGLRPEFGFAAHGEGMANMAIKLRRKLATKMAASQIGAAQRLAREWIANHSSKPLEQKVEQKGAASHFAP